MSTERDKYLIRTTESGSISYKGEKDDIRKSTIVDYPFYDLSMSTKHADKVRLRKDESVRLQVRRSTSNEDPRGNMAEKEYKLINTLVGSS